MKAVGLVVEYNPFHNGHRYHLAQAKRLTGADVVVAVMSGNFTQRGEPTILDKWSRTLAALQNGVDLVVELPVADAVQPAHRFAMGALSLLNDLQVADVVFGAEHPDWDFAAMVKAEQDFNQAAFHQFNNTYATQFNQQLEAVTGHALTDPNDILAFAYHRAKAAGDFGFQLQPIQRVNNHYADQQLTGAISSAGAIRQAVKGHQDVTETVPAQTASALAKLTTIPNWEQLYPLLANQLIQTPAPLLEQTYQVKEGLENRLKEAAERHRDFTSFLRAVKTKRYTYGRLMRVAFYLTLNLSDQDMANYHPYHRVLGFTAAGQAYLHQVKKELSYPLITKVNQRMKNAELALDYRAGKLYQFFGTPEQDLTRGPIRLV
ncbi:nucleotidyltransferase [Limosilactobacillus fermentum]|uniref:nucleotidyltransferase n=1 Tax=Limosilactobacillus fermentum TaxID=1613 RepID=UPI002F26D8D8